MKLDDHLPLLTLNDTNGPIPHTANEDAIRPPPIFVGPTPLNSPISASAFHGSGQGAIQRNSQGHRNTCLLYTSDAADE